MSENFTYANGFNISQARKVLEFYFGEFFFSAKKNELTRRFDILLKRKITQRDNTVAVIEDYADVEYFQSFFNEEKNGIRSFNIMFIN